MNACAVRLGLAGVVVHQLRVVDIRLGRPGVAPGVVPGLGPDTPEEGAVVLVGALSTVYSHVVRDRLGQTGVETDVIRDAPDDPATHAGVLVGLETAIPILAVAPVPRPANRHVRVAATRRPRVPTIGVRPALRVATRQTVDMVEVGLATWKDVPSPSRPVITEIRQVTPVGPLVATGGTTPGDTTAIRALPRRVPRAVGQAVEVDDVGAVVASAMVATQIRKGDAIPACEAEDEGDVRAPVAPSRT